jgi:hypothetical protein
MLLSQETILIKTKASCEVSMSKERQGGQERHNQSKPNQPEQRSHSGGVNKPELHPPKETPLALEPNLSGHDQQTGNLFPWMEERIRAVAQEDPKEAKRLRKEYEKYMKKPAYREFLRTNRAGTLASSAPDFSTLLEKQKKQE